MDFLTKRIERLCYNCNLFHVDCDGYELFNLEKKDCKNRVCDADNTESPIQGRAFQSLYRTKIRCGMLPDIAFAEAIVQTSDDVFQKANPDLVREYNERSVSHAENCELKRDKE